MKRAFSLLLILCLLLPPVLIRAAEDPAIRLVPEEGLPLPSEEYPLAAGRGFAFGGTVKSDLPLLRISVAVSDAQGETLLFAEATPDEQDPAATCFPLWDRTFPFGDQSLSAQLDFAALAPGTYTFTLRAATAAGEETLYASPFVVEAAKARHTLNPNDLRGLWPTAQAYLGGSLPFTYTLGTHSQIVIDNGWIGRNITAIPTPFDGSWRVNKAAAEPFEQAIRYLRATYIHVGGKWDSGVIRLSRLVRGYNGPHIARQDELDARFLSPHVLGLSVDLNRSMGPNGPVPGNWDIFAREIGENLIYNGIMEDRGRRYYDFTYVGSWGTAYERVPTILQNYLLYELAFYRAGFFWGFYYEHTCDPSHFGLGEYDPAVFSDSPRALRKVFAYIDE